MSNKTFSKHYYLIVDTETTGAGNVADFGAVVVNRKGEVLASLGVLISDIFENEKMHWSLGNPKTTKKKYRNMAQNGSRAFASVPYINRWLHEVQRAYDPVLTAYCIGFDWGKCRNTGIALDIFEKRFDLRGAAKAVICNTPEYADACEANGWFTPAGRLSEKADHVAQFVDPTLPPEPHTALEDARDYEAPILYRIIHTPQSMKQILAAGAGKSRGCKCMLGL